MASSIQKKPKNVRLLYQCHGLLVLCKNKHSKHLITFSFTFSFQNARTLHPFPKDFPNPKRPIVCGIHEIHPLDQGYFGIKISEYLF